MNQHSRDYPAIGLEPFNPEPIEIAEAWEGRGLQPIQTKYRGHLCRSRLEARWMVFFDELGMEFQYEPEGFTLPGGWRYLPDFWLPVIRFWAEVKPAALTTDESAKAAALALGSGRPVILLVGPPDFIPYAAINPMGDLGILDCRYSLDIAAGTFYATEHRLFSDPNPDSLLESGCSKEYGRAVCLSREARFDGKPAFDRSHEAKRGA